jgi:hypothetical protein
MRGAIPPLTHTSSWRGALPLPYHVLSRLSFQYSVLGNEGQIHSITNSYECYLIIFLSPNIILKFAGIVRLV